MIYRLPMVVSFALALLAPRVAAAHYASAGASPNTSPSTAPGSYAPPGPPSDIVPDQVLEGLPYVPGRLVLVMRPQVSVCVDCLIGQGQQLGAALGSDHLDDLNRRYGVRGAHALRRAYAQFPSVAERRALEARRRRRMRAAAVQRLGRLPPTRPLRSFAGAYVLELSPWLDMEKVAREYARDAAVAFAEPDRKVRVQLTPDDPYFSSAGSWGQAFDDLWGIKLIDAPTAWDTAQGDGIVVAVIDTGVDYAHPDLSENMWVNPGETAADGLDNDGNGFVDDVRGWNFVAGTNDPQDDFGHGTHVAGTIAAAGQNALGVIGVAWRSRIMALKGLDAGGAGSTSELADAILYAAENGASVINTSWGGVGQAQIIDAAIAVAAAHDVVFVAAAGNSNQDVENGPAGPFFPAANHDAIAVAAIDHLSEKAFFSNFGTKIEVAAPGGGDGGAQGEFRSVLSLRASRANTDMTGNGALVVGGDYLRQAGTSMAAPHVAGAAALIRSAHPTYSRAEVRQALRAGADDIGDPGFDIDFGYGRVDVARAVAVTVLDVAITDPASGFVATGTDVTFTGSASGAGFASYVLEYGAGAAPTSWTAIAGPATAPVDDGQLGVWDIRGVPDGAYVVRVRARNTDGAEFEDRVALTLDHVRITAPQSATIFRPAGPLEIRGAAGGNGFQSFHVEWRVTTPDYANGPWRSDGVSVTGGGTTPVTDDVLATFDTGTITQNTDVDFRVVVTGAAGEASDQVVHVVIDPTLRAGWPQQLAGLPDLEYRLMHHVTIADLDGDGKKEILAAFGDLVYVFRDDGTLKPGWPQRLDGPTAPTHWVRRSPAVGDLDGDGRLEVITTDAEHRDPGTGVPIQLDGDTYVWHADGTPMAGWPKHIARSAYGQSWGPTGDFVVTDVDGDGFDDIVTIMGGEVYVMDRDGNPLPGWPAPAVTLQRFRHLVAVGDVDGDGRKEIAAIAEDAGHRGEVLLLYSSSGTMMPGFPKRLSPQIYGRPDWQIGDYINTPVMADLDGDGTLEIAAMTNKTRVRTYRGNGTPVHLRPHVQALPDVGCESPLAPILEPPTMGDLFGDGRAEMVIGAHTRPWDFRVRGGRAIWRFCVRDVHSTDYVNLLYTGRRAVLGWPVAMPYPNGDNAYGPGASAIGDIDGDLRPEIVTGSGICGDWFDPSLGLAGHRCFTVSAFDVDGRLLPGFPKATPGPGMTQGLTPAIGDLAGDGLKEIVFIDGFGNVLVWNVPGVPAPEAMQWPMFRHDPGHTGALPAGS